MPCITLLSDFGLQDPHASCARGILLSYNDGWPIIDMSHEPSAFLLHQAAYIIAGFYRHFPEGSIHILLFDVFSIPGSHRLVVWEHNKHFFLTADNGILPLAFGETPVVRLCHEMNGHPSLMKWIHETGRIAQMIIRNVQDLTAFPVCALRESPRAIRPRVAEDFIEGHVIHIDRFENVIVNITQTLFESIGKGRPFSIRFMRSEEIRRIHAHYSDVPDGERLCRFNSAGYLELAVNRGNAASLFGLTLMRRTQLMYNTITVYFL